MQTVGFMAASSPHDHDIAFLQAYGEEAAFTGEQNILDSLLIRDFLVFPIQELLYP